MIAMVQEPTDWYALKYLGRSNGLPLADLERLISKRLLDRNDLVRRRGWDRWLPASEVAELKNSIQLATSNPPQDEPSTFKDRLIHELKSYAAIAIYLWIILLLLRLHESVVLQEYGLSPEGEHPLIIHALIIGKVVLLVEMLRIGNRVEWSIPAANILVRSVFFALCLLIFEILERFAIALWQDGTVRDGLGEGTSLAKIATVITIMTIAFVPYHFLKETQKTSRGPNLFDYLFARNKLR